MSKINSNSVSKIFNKAVERAFKYYARNRIELSLREIEFASKWMYQFNQIYSDQRIESILSKISSDNIPNHIIESSDRNSIVFIDNFGWDNKGLTQQYLRGLVSANKKITYILHNNNPIEDSDIIFELKQYQNAKIIINKTSKDNYLQCAQGIANHICDANPESILFHIAPWDVVSVLALAAIKGAARFNINLTDHAFWIGTSVLDYNIEFRGYGKTVSLQKRGLKEEQIIILPYYPIIPVRGEFEGLPELESGAIKIICGGAEYKMLGKNDIFFRLMDGILEISDKVYILVAGINLDSTFAKKVSKLKHRERIKLIGNRKDINEVFAHSDIYLSSYPFIGGLMSQYAALNGLPILAYANKEDANICDEIINYNSNSVTSKTSLNDFFNYASSLIQDQSFRISEGISAKKALITKECFNSILNETLTTNKNGIIMNGGHPKYNDIEQFYLDVENLYLHAGLHTLISHYRLRAFTIAPSIMYNVIIEMIRTIIHKIIPATLS